MHREKVALYLSILAVILLLGVLFWQYQVNYNKNKENAKLIESLSDTVKVWKDKDGKNHAKIMTLQTSRAKDFLKLKSKDSTILKLQDLVKQNKKKLSDGSSVTIIEGETKYDTIYETKEQIKYLIGDANIMDTISNKWITSIFGFNKDTTIFNLKVRNDLSLIIGEESQGWFKPKKPFAEVIDNNPYSETKNLKTYQVKDTRPKFNLKSAIYGGSFVGILLLLLNFINF